MASKTPLVWCADLVPSILPCEPLSVAVPSEDVDHYLKNEIWDASASTLHLSGASNEVLAFQLVVEKKAGTLRSVSLESGGAVSPELSLFANIAVPIQEAFYDDPVMPLDAANAGNLSKEAAKLLRVKNRKRQTYIVELYLPSGTQAGDHELTLALKCENAGDVRLEIALHVYDFELPKEPTCVADMNAYGVGPVHGWPGLDFRSERYAAIEKEFFRVIHDHLGVFHLLPYAHSGRMEHDFIPVLEGRGKNRRVKDWGPWDKHWGPYLDGSAFEGTRRGPTPLSYIYLPINLNWPAYFEKYGTPGYETEFKNVVREFAVHFAEKGWTKTKLEVFFNHKARWKYFPWDMDEIRFERDNKATLYPAKLALEAIEGIEGPQFINRIDSSWIFGKSAKSELGDAIDLWIVNGGYLAPFPDEAELLKSKGQEIFFYGGAGNIAAPSRMHNLVWPWLAWGRGVDGFTYWNALGWGGREWWKSPGGGHNHIMYPASVLGIDGALASVRMKTMRRGVQDNAYLTELTKRTGSRDAADAIIADHLGNTRGREDWWQRDEYPGGSGSDTRARKMSPRPWHDAPRSKWVSARRAVAETVEKA